MPSISPATPTRGWSFWWKPLLFLLVAGIGLYYVKWSPYYAKAFLAADNHSIGASILNDQQSSPLAAALAYRRGLDVLVGGMSQTDYSGYPDCRDNTLKALQVALSLGVDRPLTVETPLMWRDKAATWALAQELGGEALVELVRRESHTCYLGQREQLHAWGYGCGTCPACELRAKGWAQWRHALAGGRSAQGA